VSLKYYDTNTLLELQEKIFDDYFAICSKSLEELEHIKTSDKKDQVVKYKARHIVKLLDKYNDKYDVDIPDNKTFEILNELQLEATPDNIIIACAYQRSQFYSIEFTTLDVCCKLIARTKFKLNVVDTKANQQDDYKGYKEVKLGESEMAYFYSHLTENIYDLLINEYLIIKDEVGKDVATYRWDGNTYVDVRCKPVKSIAFGTLKPLDSVQSCAFDSINTNDITLLYGKAGCGKTTIPLANIMAGLEKQRYRKCYIIYSYEPLKNAKTLGFEKGSHEDKILNYSSIGNILATKFGSIDAVKSMIMNDTLEIIPTANLRGIEFSSDSVVLVTESQNLDVYTIKTIMQRCKEGCKQIYEGDVHEQTDVNMNQSGMQRVIDVFKGYEKFGCIKLKNNYRSPICELADRL
jgi:predicted ribonuclease YlaK